MSDLLSDAKKAGTCVGRVVVSPANIFTNTVGGLDNDQDPLNPFSGIFGAVKGFFTGIGQMANQIVLRGDTDDVPAESATCWNLPPGTLLDRAWSRGEPFHGHGNPPPPQK